MDTPLRRVESRPAIVLIVFTIAGCLVTGCRRQTPSTPVSGAPSAAEMSWEAQIASVRNGEGSEIRVINQPIDADQWSELNQDCDNLTILDVETLNVPEDSLSVLSGLPQLRRLQRYQRDGRARFHDGQLLPLRPRTWRVGRSGQNGGALRRRHAVRGRWPGACVRHRVALRP